MRSGVRPALRRGLRLAALALTLAAGGALAQETLEVRLQAPDELRPLLERHVRLLRQEALALPEEPADRSAMTRRARREVAGLLATEGYFSPRVRFDRSDARNWLLENQSGCVHFLAKRRIEAGSQLEEVGKDLRGKMSWGTKVEEL